MLSDEWFSRYGLLENFNASVTRTRTGTGTWTTGVTAIALCTSCSRANESSCIQILNILNDSEVDIRPMVMTDSAVKELVMLWGVNSNTSC